MKPTSKEVGASPHLRGEDEDRRKAERRLQAERRGDVIRAATGNRREADARGVGAAMVDALEDILRWERASERSLKAAKKADDLPN